MIAHVLNVFKDSTPKQKINTLVNAFESLSGVSSLRSLPQVVDIVLTKSCNLKCRFCKPYKTPGQKQVELSYLETLAKQLLPTARLVSICSGGEPYLHPQFLDALRIVRSYKVATWVLSNGMLLNDNLIRTVVEEELITRHGFSVDGIRESTVESIRVGAKLALILENIDHLLHVRKQYKKKKPSVLIRYALMRSNVEELPEAVEYWGERGIDRINCDYVWIYNDMPQEESLYFHQEQTKIIFQKAQGVASRYPFLTLSLPPLFSNNRNRYRWLSGCFAPWYFTMIDTDGRIFPCYRSWGTIVMGNIYEEPLVSFKRIWNGDLYMALRDSTRKTHTNKFFQFCSQCPNRVSKFNMEGHMSERIWQDIISPDN